MVRVSSRFLQKCAQPRDDSPYVLAHINLCLSTRRHSERTIDLYNHRREFLIQKRTRYITGSTTTVTVNTVVVLNGCERDGQGDGHLDACCYRGA